MIITSCGDIVLILIFKISTRLRLCSLIFFLLSNRGPVITPTFPLSFLFIFWKKKILFYCFVSTLNIPRLILTPHRTLTIVVSRFQARGITFKIFLWLTSAVIVQSPSFLFHGICHQFTPWLLSNLHWVKYITNIFSRA